MPMLIEHIDAIARTKGRDVLCLEFPQEDNDDPFAMLDVDWDRLPIRLDVIEWLNQNQIEWCMCANFASENSMCGYGGMIVSAP